MLKSMRADRKTSLFFLFCGEVIRGNVGFGSTSFPQTRLTRCRDDRITEHFYTRGVFLGQLRKKNSLLKKTEDNAVCGSFSYSLICTFVSSVQVVLLIITIIIIVINIIITIIIITVRHCRVSIWLLWASACIKPTTTTTTTMQVGGCCCHRDHIWYRLCSALCPGTAARLYLYSKNKNKSKHLTVFMPLLIWLIGIY